MPQRFTRLGQVTLDATGGGQAVVFVSGRECDIIRAVVSTTSQTKQPTALMYRNNAVQAQRIDGTYTGAQDTAQNLGRYQPGESLIAVWSGGDVGAIATLRVEVIQYEPGRAPPDGGTAYQPFANSVVGGVTLVRPAIQSPGYSTGATGWTINADGSAEFNNVTIRGQLQAKPTASAGDLVMTVRVAGDTNDRFELEADGSMFWGPGSAPTDCTFFRELTGRMKFQQQLHVSGLFLTDSDVQVGGNLTVAGIGQTQFVRKTADQNRTNNNTLINDLQLLLPLATNATYELDGQIIYQASGAAAVSGYTAAFGLPAGATLDWVWHGKIDTDGAATAASIWQFAETAATSRNSGGAGIGTSLVGKPTGLLVTGGTAGNLQYQFAQATANATASVTKAGSYLILRRVA
jgi:hypothetical protein